MHACCCVLHVRTGGQRGRGAGEITVSSSSTLGILNVFCAVASCGYFNLGQARPGSVGGDSRKCTIYKRRSRKPRATTIFPSISVRGVSKCAMSALPRCLFQPVFIVFSSCSCSFSFSLLFCFVFFSSFGNFYAALKWCNCCGCRFFCCYPTASSSFSSACCSSSFSSSFSRSSLKCSTWLRCAGFNTDWANWIAFLIKLSFL